MRLVEFVEFDALLVAKLDRLGRNLLHLLTLMQQLDTLGIRVICVGDGLDTRTPAGRLMLQLLGVFAEFERERIRERSAEGVRRRVEDGGFVESLSAEAASGCTCTRETSVPASSR